MTETNIELPRPVARRAGYKHYRFLIGGVIVALAVAYLVFSAANGAAAYYLTVAELLSQNPGARSVRVSGIITEGSIVWSERELQLTFEIEDATGRLPVVYQGSRPDMFRDGAEVVIEGQYEPGQVFEAKSLMLKCPSKYEGADANG